MTDTTAFTSIPTIMAYRSHCR